MKKNRYKVGVVLFVAVFVLGAMAITSCKQVKHEIKWYTNFDEAKQVAQKMGLNILLLVKSDLDKAYSSEGTKYLVENKEFVKAASGKYVCVFFDFTNLKDRLEQNSPTTTDNSKDVASLKVKRDDLLQQFSVADMFLITDTPAARLATADGFFIADADFDYTKTTLQDYMDTLNNLDPQVNEMVAKVDATKTGTAAEKISAIESIYDTASESARLLLVPLYDAALKIDPKNSTGKLSKLIAAKAHAASHDKLLQKDFLGAVDIYENAAGDKRLSKTDSQALYYIAANILANVKDSDTEKVKSLLVASINADPDSEYVPNLKQLLEYVQQLAGDTIEPQHEAGNSDGSPAVEGGESPQSPQASEDTDIDEDLQE